MIRGAELNSKDKEIIQQNLMNNLRKEIGSLRMEGENSKKEIISLKESIRLDKITSHKENDEISKLKVTFHWAKFG